MLSELQGIELAFVFTNLLRVPYSMFEGFFVIDHVIIHRHNDCVWIIFNPQRRHKLGERPVVDLGAHDLEIWPGC